MKSVMRVCLIIAAAYGLSGCMPDAKLKEYGLSAYAARIDRGHQIPKVSGEVIEPHFMRKIVVDPTGEKPGTIVVDTNRRYLYYVLDDRKAVRYGIGVGREGFSWSGRAIIKRKAAWPTWTPPKEMLQRRPDLMEHAGGMRGGIKNPLGARALYLYQGNRDTLYRLHGTNEPWSIGRAMSSGCIRMLNQDIIDLHGRAKIGTPVVVKQG